MKKFFKSIGFKILLGLLIVFFAFMLHAAKTGGISSITSQLTGFIVKPLQQFTANIAGAVSQFFDKYLRADEIYQENQQLKEQLAKMNEKMVEFDKYKNENEQYEKYLDIREQHSDFSFVPATVIGRDPNSRFSSFTINQGSSAGISYRDPVITSDGLVGYVSEVGLTYAKVVTILDPSTNIGAYNSRTLDTGILTGNAEYADEGYCVLSYLSKDSLSVSGDLVLTSGVSGEYPRELIIGTIVDIQAETNGLSLYAVVKPAADIANVKSVFVITDFEGKGNP